MRGSSEPTREARTTFDDELYSFERWRSEQGLRSAGLRERRPERRYDSESAAAHNTDVTFPRPVRTRAVSLPTRPEDAAPRGTAALEHLEERLAAQESRLQREVEAFKALHGPSLQRLRDHYLPSLEKYIAAMAEHQQALARAQTRIERLEKRVGDEVTTAAHHLREVASIVRDLAAIRDAAATPSAPSVPTLSATTPGPVGATGDAPVSHGLWQRRLARHAAVLLSAALVTTAIAVAGVGVSSRIDDLARQAAAAERESRAARQDLVASGNAVQQTRANVLSSLTDMQRLTNIIVAPDVRSFALSGTAHAPGATGQALWSSTRGVVITAAGMETAPAGQTYQAWLVTEGGTSSLGLVAPGHDGQLTAVFDAPSRLAGTVIGALVTSEPTGGSKTPGRHVTLRH